MLPLQQLDELHQKDLRKVAVLVHIQGPVNEAVSTGGHVSGLKSNRQVLRVQTCTLASTCRYSSHTAVSTFRNSPISQFYDLLTDLWTFD